MHCLVPPLMQVPEGDWYCPECLARPNEVGFEEGKVYNLRTFKDMADRFKRTHFQEVFFFLFSFFLLDQSKEGGNNKLHE